MNLESRLEKFARTNGFNGKGPLSVALVITQKARKGLPLDPDKLVTGRRGQVEGLGKTAVQAVLEKHGIIRVLSEEGGRTSRGSLDNMRNYVIFLNSIQGIVDLDAVEKFWVQKVRAFFAGKPFKFRTDASESVRSSVRNLLSQAKQRQRDIPGSRYEGTMLQHLVGAKLQIILGEGNVKHHKASEADQAESRSGDFNVGDVSIHVTTNPGEAVIRKCQQNINAGLRPVLVTVGKGCAVGEGLAEQAGISERLDILDAEQFLAANLHEWAKFSAALRKVRTTELISIYNKIIDAVEGDPSLKVAF